MHPARRLGSIAEDRRLPAVRDPDSLTFPRRLQGNDVLDILSILAFLPAFQGEVHYFHVTEFKVERFQAFAPVALSLAAYFTAVRDDHLERVDP